MITGASLRFGSRIVLSDFSATFPENRLSCLVGPSGSGKSTLLACIAGYQRLDSGGVTFHSNGGTSDSVSHRDLTWISQTSNMLTSRSALDNVLLGPLADGLALREATRRSHHALDQVGLPDKARTAVRLLSGGEVQRVAFARGLASRKPLILADEPSASLDAANAEGLAHLLRNLRAAATVIVATHDPLLVTAADSTVSLR